MKRNDRVEVIADDFAESDYYDDQTGCVGRIEFHEKARKDRPWGVLLDGVGYVQMFAAHEIRVSR